MQEFCNLLFGTLPFCPKRPQDDRLDKLRDLVRIGVMRANLRPFIRVKEALKQGTKNCRIDEAPVEATGSDQQSDIAFVKWQRATAIEEAAVEPGDVIEVEVAAVLHRLEELVQITLCFLGTSGGLLQQLRKKAFREQLHAVGEETEHQLVDKMRDLVRHSPSLQAERDGRELVGRLSRHGSACLGRL